MKVYLKPRVIKHLAKIPTPVWKLVTQKIESLENSPFPSGSKKLLARDGYRIRVGDYRILYMFNKKKKEITILSVTHRREAYKF